MSRSADALRRMYSAVGRGWRRFTSHEHGANRREHFGRRSPVSRDSPKIKCGRRGPRTARLSSAAMSETGTRLDVSTADGSMLRAELFTPVGEGPHPGVVVLHESFGLNDDMRRIARRFAGAGYCALAPDLYSHGSRIVCLSRVMVDMLRGSVAREISDIRAARDVLAARPEVDAERIAVAGFCRAAALLSSPAPSRASRRPPSTMARCRAIGRVWTACVRSSPATGARIACSGPRRLRAWSAT